MIIFIMFKNKYIALVGNDKDSLNKHLEKMIKEEGDFNFAKSVEEFQPMQKYIILNASEDMYKIIDNYDTKFIIISKYLYTIPIEIRVLCDIKIFNKSSDFFIEQNKIKQFCKLFFQKYIPKDLIR